MNPAFIALGGANIGLIGLAFTADRYIAQVERRIEQVNKLRTQEVFDRALADDAAERRAALRSFFSLQGDKRP